MAPRSECNSSVNIPWPEKGMGDAEYIYAFMKIVMPIAMEFAPELVISERLFTLRTFLCYNSLMPGQSLQALMLQMEMNLENAM